MALMIPIYLHLQTFMIPFTWVWAGRGKGIWLLKIGYMSLWLLSVALLVHFLWAAFVCAALQTDTHDKELKPASSPQPRRNWGLSPKVLEKVNCPNGRRHHSPVETPGGSLARLGARGPSKASPRCLNQRNCEIINAAISHYMLESPVKQQ